jgi:hypothetical protein
MDLLPDDLKCKIFQELDAVHLCRLSALSKYTRILVDAPESWEIVHGISKHEARETHLKNSADLLCAEVNLEKCKAELDVANTRALVASSEMNATEDRTVNRYRETDWNSLSWNTYNSAVSNLVFAENKLEEAEANIEEAELEQWRINGISKLERKNLGVPLRLRRAANEALEEWKLADAATRRLNPVCSCYLTSREKIGWKIAFEKERTTWWVARKAFREISRWEGKVTPADILGDTFLNK